MEVLLATVLLAFAQPHAQPVLRSDAGPLLPLDAACQPHHPTACRWRVSSPLLAAWRGGSGSFPASVPGDLISDLQANGVVPDPWRETNFLDNSSVWTLPDYSYSRNFTVPTAVAASARLLLVVDSVKMGAMVSLNGVALGNTTDQFLRYEFDVTDTIQQAVNTLALLFSPTVETAGRFMPCTGGWDWAPWSHTNDSVGAPTFSKGIVGSVYLLPIEAVAIRHLVPQVHFLGPHPTSPLRDGAHAGFDVAVRLYLKVVAAVNGTLKVQGSWGGASATATRALQLTPSDETVVVRQTTAQRAHCSRLLAAACSSHRYVVVCRS